MRGIGIVSVHILEVGSEIELFGGTAAGVSEASKSHVVQVDRAQSGCARTGDVCGCLEHVQLCPQTGSKISSGHVERFIRRLQVLCFALEYTVGLLKIEKSAAHFRGNATPCRCQGLHRCITPGARSLHSPLGREPIEDIPCSVNADNAAVVKFRTDVRVALAVNFISRESAHMWTRRAAIQNVLLTFDLDVLCFGLDDPTIRVAS